MFSKKNIIFISGPTSSGKSDLAIKIADKISGEIINADSMQVYNDLKIITSRPSESDLKKVKHHLYGHVSGNNRYNVYNWCKDCLNKIEQVSKNNKIPIIIGGTGLYFSSLVNGISDIPTIPEYIKLESNTQLLNLGSRKFYKIVESLDQKACSQININDTQRLKRIWEIITYTGVSLSEWKKKLKHNFIKEYEYKLILILPSKDNLYKRCNERFLNMIKQGAVEEVKRLRKKNYNPSLPIMKAHGVPEIINYLDNNVSLDAAIANAQKVTRNYVKRQFTWWRGSNIKSDHIINDFPVNIDLNKLEILKNTLID